MRLSVLGPLAFIAATLVLTTGCATAHRVVGPDGTVTFQYATAMQSPALTTHQVTAEAAAQVAVGGECLRFTQTTRGGTTSLQTGSWNCGALATPYGYGLGVPMVPQGYGQGELEALAARGYGPGVVASMPSPGAAPPAGPTDPALAAQVKDLRQDVDAMLGVVLAPPAR